MQAQFHSFRRIITRREILHLQVRAGGVGRLPWSIPFLFQSRHVTLHAFAGARGKDWAKLGLFGDWLELVRLAIF
jgi:hypothetical protein